MKIGRPKQQKHCGLCGTTDLFAFSKNGNGLQGRCKECFRYTRFLKTLGLKPGPTIRTPRHESKEIRNGRALACQQIYRQDHPELIKQRHRQSRYKVAHGLSLEDLHVRIVLQGSLCPIGHHLFDLTNAHQDDSPCVDHDHKTGNYRAILCNRHNRALGQFHDSIAEIQDALFYLTYYTER